MILGRRMMMRGPYRVALITGLVALAATSLEAAEIDHPTDEITNSVRVVNNSLSRVQVYAEDSKGRLHMLGHVALGELKEFEIPEEIAQESFRIKAFPSRPVWFRDELGMKTSPIDLERYSEVTVWLTRSLSQSRVATVRS